MKTIKVDSSNVSEHGFYCLRNPKNPGFGLKNDWLKNRFKEGLRIRIAVDDKENQLGFIEYTPAEYAFRPVKAPGYMFIHCVLLFKKPDKSKGVASRLIHDVIDDARRQKMKGVVTFASDGTWMASRHVFEKNGFEVIDSKDRFDLTVLKFRKADDPKFIDWERNQKKYMGLNLIYANQCPLFYKSVTDLTEIAEMMGVELKVKEIKTAKQAQGAPSGYGVYSLVYDGKLLADHYISGTRFKSILKKEVI